LGNLFRFEVVFINFLVDFFTDFVIADANQPEGDNGTDEQNKGDDGRDYLKKTYAQGKTNAKYNGREHKGCHPFEVPYSFLEKVIKVRKI